MRKQVFFLFLRRGFSLIELLVVIAVLAVLMGLALPAIGGALNSAKRATMQNDVTQIANAVMMFETEYGRLPNVSGGNVDDSLMRILLGEDDNENPRKIAFLEPPTYKPGKGGYKAGQGYLDPWGNPYKIALDTDYDNKVSARDGEVRKKVAVWNDEQSIPDMKQSQKARMKVQSW
ncbi:MAG: prepilin-type N-terminal cleavage/methylation domain-containing protein [Chthoniobacterales bacterium]|nr:prepilin-type N-terminal cleavage/methylation domain-containing protein [Chthoniobacterales bacterium]